MPGAIGSIAAAWSRSATWIRQSAGQKVFSRMNSVSTAMKSLFPMRSQNSNRAALVSLNGWTCIARLYRDRNSSVKGRGVAVRVDLGDDRNINKKKKKK